MQDWLIFLVSFAQSYKSIRMYIFKGCIFFAILTCFAHAGDPSAIALPSTNTIPQERPSFGFQLENDLFLADDDNYTNGIRFSFLSKSCDNQAQGTSDALAKSLGTLTGGTNASPAWSKFCGMDRNASLRQQWAVTLTQLMFTPKTMSSKRIIGEHPYAGYLALGIGTLVKDEDTANSFELQLGTTGHASLADRSQNTIHDMWQIDKWPNWKSQLPSEFAFCFYFKKYYRLRFLEYKSGDGFETDGFAYWHTDLGTVYLRGGVGMSYRFGYNLPNTSVDFPINGATYLNNPFVKRENHTSNWSIYGFTGFAVRAIGHDLFLDGTVFHNSPHYVDKYPVVCDVNAGVGARYKNVDFLFGLFFRSQEYVHQEPIHAMGSFEIKISF